MRKLLIGLVAGTMVLFGWSGRAAEIKAGDKVFRVGLRMQSWLQVNTKDAEQIRVDGGIRRAYFYFGGTPHPKFSYFAILAGDKIGFAGVDKAGVGVGTGFALRDAWVTANVHPLLKIQIGRMYVPFLRGFGTEAAFAIQPLDLSDMQVGPMVPNRRAARDDGLVLWGNYEGGRLQYRLGLMDAKDSKNATFRLVGRVVLNLITPEPKWFTSAAMLSGKGIVSLGAGFDRIPDFDGEGHDYLGLTGDAYVSYPLGEAIQLIGEAAVARIDQSDQTWTGLYLFGTVGAVLKSVELPWVGTPHPYVRFETFQADEAVENKPAVQSEISGGLHLYPIGLSHAAKITLDATQVTKQDDSTYVKGTVQFQVSF